MELKNQIINFYKLIANENNTPALGNQFAIFFNLPPLMGGQGPAGEGYSATNAVDGLYQNLALRENSSGTVYSNPAGQVWGGIYAMKDIVNNNIIQTYGWLYATKVTIPTDGYEVRTIGEYGLGFPKGTIGMGRTPFSKLIIDFLETNASITDYIIRPWTILVAHNGLKISTVKSSVHVLPLMRRGLPQGAADNVPRKVFSFFNCFPVESGSETLTHDTRMVEKSIMFNYDWYSISRVAPLADYRRNLQGANVANATGNLGSGFA